MHKSVKGKLTSESKVCKGRAICSTFLCKMYLSLHMRVCMPACLFVHVCASAFQVTAASAATAVTYHFRVTPVTIQSLPISQDVVALSCPVNISSVLIDLALSGCQRCHESQVKD